MKEYFNYRVTTKLVKTEAITILSLPLVAPFAVSDLLSSDMVEVLFELGGN